MPTVNEKYLQLLRMFRISSINLVEGFERVGYMGLSLYDLYHVDFAEKVCPYEYFSGHRLQSVLAPSDVKHDLIMPTPYFLYEGLNISTSPTADKPVIDQYWLPDYGLLLIDAKFQQDIEYEDGTYGLDTLRDFMITKYQLGYAGSHPNLATPNLYIPHYVKMGCGMSLQESAAITIMRNNGGSYAPLQ